MIPISEKQESSYENFEAECPHCGGWNIFNRASDLNDVRPIDYKVVTCEESQCNKEFAINYDCVNPAFEMLLWECEQFLTKKKYMSCILHACQALEVFFSSFFRERLVLLPCAPEYKKHVLDLNAINLLFENLFKATKQDSFGKLRNIFLNVVLEELGYLSRERAKEILNELQFGTSKLRKKPSKKSISSMENEKLSEILLTLYDSKIGEKRNLVIHKYAVRPTREDTSELFSEAHKIIHGLKYQLDFHAVDINAILNYA